MSQSFILNMNIEEIKSAEAADDDSGEFAPWND